MEIYRAYQFVNPVDSGGSTKPWVVDAVDHHGNSRRFVVKLFTPTQMVQQWPVAKEVYGNVLAGLFDLPVPEMGLIEFGEIFLSTLEPEYRADYRRRAPGPHFGCEWVEHTPLFNDLLTRRQWEEYETATIFAFDSLIYNTDRGGYRKKPNLLVTDKECFLIDHELAFAFADQPPNVGLPPIVNFLEDSWLCPADRHVFFPLLHQLTVAKRKALFGEFHEVLRYLPTDVLNEPASVLRDNGVATGDVSFIQRYLETVKQQSGRFIQTLRNSLA